MASATSASAVPGDGEDAITTGGLGLSAGLGLSIGRPPTGAPVGAPAVDVGPADVDESPAWPDDDVVEEHPIETPSASRLSVTAKMVDGFIERWSDTTQ